MPRGTKEEFVDTAVIVRSVSGVLFVVLLAILVLRRKKRTVSR